MRDLAVQASNASLSSTERGYLDVEQAKLATTLGSVIDQSQFNGTDLVDDTNGKVFHIHAGADAGDAIDVSISAMTETVLGVTASAIDLANSGGSAEYVTFAPTMHTTGQEIVSIGVTDYATTDGTYVLTVGTETFTTASVTGTGSGSEAGSQTAVINDLQSRTGSAGNTLADLGITVSANGTEDGIVLTYGTNANQAETTYSLTAGGDGEAISTASINDGDTGIGTYAVTIGNSTYSSGNVAFTTDAATTATAIQTALRAATDSTTGQTMLQDLGVTATVTNGSIVLTYADSENVAESTYSLAVTGTGASAGVAAVITEGVNTARNAITAIDSALGIVASERAKLGATQAQLESTVRNLANVAENTSAAAGRIMDTDYAAETANLTKAQILQQAATSILAQANAQPQAVLSLLQ
jgi:flagellin